MEKFCYEGIETIKNYKSIERYRVRKGIKDDSLIKKICRYSSYKPQTTAISGMGASIVSRNIFEQCLFLQIRKNSARRRTGFFDYNIFCVYFSVRMVQ